MKKINNWNNVQAISDRPQLPVNGYVCRIMDAKVVSYPTSTGGTIEKLEISIDVAEGEYKDFYANDYRTQTQEDKRWKGVLRLYVPQDDGTDLDNFSKRKLKSVTDAIEDSNNGFHWDWDETALKNKMVGIVFRNEEWEFDGKSGFIARPFYATSVDAIRGGRFKIPAEKLVDKNKVSNTNKQDNLNDVEIPF